MAAKRGGGRWSELGLVVAILALGVGLTLTADTIHVRGSEVNNFLRAENLLANVLVPMSWVAILALGATVVIVSGGIDVSVGSVFALSALATAAITERLDVAAPAGLVLPLALGVALGVGAACGLVNGLLIVGLRLHPFIATLGTLSIFRGLALVAVEEKTLPSIGRSLPRAFTEDGVGARVDFAGAFLQPVPIAVMLGAALCAWLFLARTVWGREVYAVGGNEEAARYAGIAVGRVKLRVYVLAGLAAGLAGFVSTGFYQSANTATGEGLELAVIAAAVVGGAGLSGGRGTALGAFLGALLIKLIENGIDVVKRVDLGLLEFAVSKEYSKIILGLAIVVAVAIDRMAGARR
ncbi:MAG: ABC transporter permease [Planctomycetes bacterium]|nr:ABC transporter permease [Planctomycetota bacterium]